MYEIAQIYWPLRSNLPTQQHILLNPLDIYILAHLLDRLLLGHGWKQNLWGHDLLVLRAISETYWDENSGQVRNCSHDYRSNSIRMENVEGWLFQLIVITTQQIEICMRHGFTRLSKPHSGPRSRRVATAGLRIWRPNPNLRRLFSWTSLPQLLLNLREGKRRKKERLASSTRRCDAHVSQESTRG